MLAAREVGLLSLFCRGHRVALKPAVELVEVALIQRTFGVTFVVNASPPGMVGKSLNTMHMDKCGKIPNCSLSEEGQIDYDQPAGAEGNGDFG